jgi:glutaredoxin-related protein
VFLQFSVNSRSSPAAQKGGLLYVSGVFVGGNSDLQEANTNGKLAELLAKK